MKIKCKNINNGKIKVFNSVKDILKEINRDRSNEWSNYNEKDWREGLEVFTEYKLINVY